ncbi:response regulator transcription factor [Aquabacterium humicola]|uniref:response regulator transcription factor n=1 Tax=Aquabacterium humicola TaxID=3237377 RepID=UPI0025435C68|nr:response regulator transcription factor [Rubrivivax pictus]
MRALHILLVEDDADLAQAVAAHLRAAGHAVTSCRHVGDARAAAADLVLLDLALPDGEGLALLREWRSAGDPRPVIVLSAREQLSDRLRALRDGADDYLVKPFDLDEMLARIDAVARRAGRPPRQALRIGNVLLDPAARHASRSGAPIDLTAMEWSVIACLAGRPGRIYGRSDIEHALAAAGLGDADSNSLEVIVSRLRKKLGPRAISTHRGLGYRLELPSDAA